MTHASMDPALRKEAGINENLVRLSVGLEDIRDLLDDLDQALTFARPRLAVPALQAVGE